MSCSEVMYQAYYPYLYQRPGGAPPVSAHPVPRAGPFSSPFTAAAAHQYDRFAAQRLQESHSDHHSVAHSSLYLQQAGGSGGASSTPSSAAAPVSQQLAGPHSSAGSVSSTGGVSPGSQRGKEEECSLHGRSSTEVTHHAPGAGLDDSDSDEEATSSRAQYVSANCVVFTHYQGDASTQVDEHFSRALDKTTPAKEPSPMTSRNFPASFWNSHYTPLSNQMSSGGHELYGHGGSEHYHPEWYHGYSSHYHQHHAAAAGMAAAAGYSGLLLPGRGLHVPAAHAHAHAPCKAVDWQHSALDSGYAYGMSGLEAQVQESSKDLYWF